jgi:hypothetical protein
MLKSGRTSAPRLPHAGCAHFAEGDFLRAIHQNVPSFARCIAGDAGFLTLIQCAHGPAR